LADCLQYQKNYIGALELYQECEKIQNLNQKEIHERKIKAKYKLKNYSESLKDIKGVH